MSFIVFGDPSFLLVSLVLLSWRDVEYLQKAFAASIQMIIALISVQNVLHSLTYICWTIFTSLQLSQLHHDVKSFLVLLTSTWKYYIENFSIHAHQSALSIILLFVIVSLPSFGMSTILDSYKQVGLFLPFVTHGKVWGILC
jgi:hypothetical protein